jgi:PIN domain nuclease of toxin-antitoxin system
VNILLDTCTFLWLVSDAPELSDKARRLVINPSNTISLSAASAWEIIVKNRLGKLPLPMPADQFVYHWRTSHQIATLPLDEAAVFQLARLPDYHKDPFDRMIICQAIAGGLVILTPDIHISQYPVRTDW